MRARVRQYRNGKWISVEVITDPLRARFKEFPGSQHPGLEEWAQSLAPVLIEGRSTRFSEDPEGWLRRMAKMHYTRISVELLD